MTEDELKKEMDKVLHECFNVEAMTNFYVDQMQTAFLKGLQLGMKIGKENAENKNK